MLVCGRRARSTPRHMAGRTTTSCVVLACLGFGLVALLRARGKQHAPTTPSSTNSPPVPPPPSLRLPDYRLKWLGAGAQTVSISGDWNGWTTTTGIPMTRDETGAFAADVYLPMRCPRRNLIMRGVCCYRYKFFIDTGTRRRWLHDPRQPMDKDPDGWVNNFMCKYANGHDGAPLRTMPEGWRRAGKDTKKREEHLQGMGNGGGDGGDGVDGAVPTTGVGARAEAALAAKARAASNQAAAAAAAASLAQKYSGGHAAAKVIGPPPPPPPVEVCLVLPATYFNGTTLSTTTTRGLGACCEMCRRRRGCAAYNWRPEPLARNCVLFGPNYGVPRGTALCSAGIVRVPLLPIEAPETVQVSSGGGDASGGNGAKGKAGGRGARRGKRKPKLRKRRLALRRRHQVTE